MTGSRTPKDVEDLVLDEASFVVVDVETTGMNALDDRITEIAMMRVHGSQLVDEFSTLVNPLMTIPAFITDLTGIDNVMVTLRRPGRWLRLSRSSWKEASLLRITRRSIGGLSTTPFCGNPAFTSPTLNCVP
jgi:oligoribonuclease (3'-5' exoribonuclease)